MKEEKTGAVITAGAVCGAYLESIIDYPWIALKIRLQTSGLPLTYFIPTITGFIKEAAHAPLSRIPYFLFLGLKMPWQGLVPFQMSLIPSTVMQRDTIFYSEDVLKKFPYLPSMMGGAISSLVATPMEFIILEQQKRACSPFFSARILLREGWQRPWLGLVPTAIREIGFSWTVWYGSMAVKKQLETFPKMSHLDSSVLFLLSATVCGVFGSFVTHPFDVIGTIMQRDRNRSMKDVSKNIFNTAGAKGFFPGFIFRTFSTIGASFWLEKLSRKADKVIAENVPFFSSEC